MFDVNEMNIAAQLGEQPGNYLIDEPRHVLSYLGAGGIVLLLGAAGEDSLRWIYFASISKADDIVQNTAIFNAMQNGTFHLQVDRKKVLQHLGISLHTLHKDWYALDIKQTPEDERTPEPYAKVIAHASRLLTEQARLRAGDDSYRSVSQFAIQQCVRINECKTREAFLARYGALNRLVIDDKCMILTENAQARKAYLAMRSAVEELDDIYDVFTKFG